MLVALVSAGVPVLAQDAALKRCRAIVDSGARLRCYDALPVTPTPESEAAAAAMPRAAPPLAGAAAATLPKAERFGLEHKDQVKDELPTIATHIPGRFEGWRPNSTIQLANGQVWQVVDDTSRYVYLDNPKVVVRRGMFGAFFLDIEGDNRSPRVRRVQ